MSARILDPERIINDTSARSRGKHVVVASGNFDGSNARSYEDQFYNHRNFTLVPVAACKQHRLVPQITR